MTPSPWPSLAPQRALAARLHGGEAALAAWLAEQEARVGDGAFAALFSDHLALPGVAPLDYAHRRVRTARGALLGGVRFYGLDPARPFVEVVAHDFDDPAALAAAVRDEWRAFRPRALRLLSTPRALPQGARLDMGVHLAPYGRMAPPRAGVALGRFPSSDDAQALVAARYAALPDALRRDLRPIAADRLAELHREGRAHAILADGAVAGLLAVAPGAEAWIAGDVVEEQAVALAHAGRGLAAAAQSALAARSDPATPLVGTIHAANHASRRTALRAGRPAVLAYAFLPLPR